MTAPQVFSLRSFEVEQSANPKVQSVFCGVFFGLSILTLGLMALGSSTRVMNAGLSCPDWPLCFGTLMPSEQMNIQVFLEWFHRVVASSVGFIMIGVNAAVYWFRRELPRWLPLAALGSLGIVITQGILGGLTVTELLRFDIVTAHLATGLLFFSTLLTIATFLLPYRGTGAVKNLHWFGLVSVLCVYGQSILGALVASRWAAHQCLASSSLCHVLTRHYVGVVPATLSVLLVLYLSWRTPALHPWLRRLTLAGLGLLLLQVSLGLSTLKFHLQLVTLTVAHQAVGASLLGVCIVYSVIAIRDRRQEQSYQMFSVPNTKNLGTA
ncbi:MAG: COX15/CtaA family protein [Cyanobacteria bacterium P01_F01_bin.3]